MSLHLSPEAQFLIGLFAIVLPLVIIDVRRSGARVAQMAANHERMSRGPRLNRDQVQS